MRQKQYRLWLAGAAIGAAMLPAGSVLAADLPVKAPPVAPAVLDWSGVYLGVHAGYGGGMKDWVDLGTDFAASGALLGGQVGINKQLGSFVFGLELDGSWADVSGSQSVAFGGPLLGLSASSSTASKINGIGILAARAGLAADRWFVFAKAGAAVAQERHSWLAGFSFGGSAATISATGNETRWGTMVGFGAEYALIGNWSLTGEYNYLHLPGREMSLNFTTTQGGVTTSGIAPNHIEQAIHLIKLGANYRFGWPASEPRFAAVSPTAGTSWPGAYIGAQGGYAAEQETWPAFAIALTGFPGGGTSRSDSWLAGLNGGLNAQAGSFVFGVEGEWMWTGLKASQTTASPFLNPGSTVNVTSETRIDWLAIASARAGFVVGDKLLVYGKGGVAIADERHSVSVAAFDPLAGTVSGTLSAKAVHTGGVIGVGAEYAFAGNWSAKIEYDYIRMLGQRYTAPGSLAFAGPISTGSLDLGSTFDSMSQNLHLLKFGVNYHFNAMPALVTARY